MNVCVIGGGAVGAFCAWRIAQSGATVDLVEPRALAVADPQAASWAAAGMLGAVSEALGAQDPDRRLALGRVALDSWRRAQNDLGGALLSAFGSMLAADTPVRSAQIEDLATKARAAGFRADWVRSKALADLGFALAPTSAHALHLPDERRVDIPATLAALGAVIAGAGVRTHTDVAMAVGQADGRLRVSLASGASLTCDRVVAAPGIGTSATTAFDGLAASVPALAHLRPAKGQMALLAATAPFVVRGGDIYLVPRSDGLAIGATMEAGLADRTVDPAAIERLRDAAIRLAPSLASAPIVRAWAGVRPMSPDHDPIIGPSGPPGCLVAAGHSRNGWLLAPLTADMIVAQIFDRSPPLPASFFDPERFREGAPHEP